MDTKEIQKTSFAGCRSLEKVIFTSVVKIDDQAFIGCRKLSEAIYTPNGDCGDFVIVINASKVAYSGDQEEKKYYYNASGWARGIRSRSIGVMSREYPVELVERAVWGMIPKGRLGRQIYKKLFVYEGNEHKHEAQKPEVLELKY